MICVAKAERRESKPSVVAISARDAHGRQTLRPLGLYAAGDAADAGHDQDAEVEV